MGHSHTLVPSWAKSWEAKHAWLSPTHKVLLKWFCLNFQTGPSNTPPLRTPVLSQGWEAIISGQ